MAVDTELAQRPPAPTSASVAPVAGVAASLGATALSNAATARAGPAPAAAAPAGLGNAATARTAQAPVVRPSSGERCDLELEDIRLFPAREWEHPLFDRSMSRTIWTGEISLGDYGYITVDLTGKVRAEGVVTSQLGPGLLRNICLARDPASGEYRGSAELFVPANVTPEVTFGGSLHGKGEYLDLLPLVTVEGGLDGRGSAAFLGALRGPISLALQPPPAPVGDTEDQELAAGVGASKRERARQAYAALVATDQPVTGARLAEAAGVSASYGRALLAEFQADPTLAAGQANGQRPTVEEGER